MLRFCGCGTAIGGFVILRGDGVIAALLVVSRSLALSSLVFLLAVASHLGANLAAQVVLMCADVGCAAPKNATVAKNATHANLAAMCCVWKRVCFAIELGYCSAR